MCAILYTAGRPLSLVKTHNHISGAPGCDWRNWNTLPVSSCETRCALCVQCSTQLSHRGRPLSHHLLVVLRYKTHKHIRGEIGGTEIPNNWAVVRHALHSVFNVLHSSAMEAAHPLVIYQQSFDTRHTSTSRAPLVAIGGTEIGLAYPTKIRKIC